MRSPAWNEFVLPWEEPSWWHPIRKLKWRRRQERIFWLEWHMGIAQYAIGTPMYWVDDFGGCA